MRRAVAAADRSWATRPAWSVSPEIRSLHPAVAFPWLGRRCGPPHPGGGPAARGRGPRHHRGRDGGRRAGASGPTRRARSRPTGMPGRRASPPGRWRAPRSRRSGTGHRTVPTRTLRSLVDEHLAGHDVHFCKIDAEGAEAEVIASADLEAWRPWVLVIESTHPNTAEPTFMKWQDGVLAAGYRLCLFDGLSRFYVSEERATDLEEKLSYPACPLDDYVPASSVRLRNELQDLQRTHHERIEALEREVEDLRHDLVRWRRAAVDSWAGAVATHGGAAQAELDAMRRTVSWRGGRPPPARGSPHG